MLGLGLNPSPSHGAGGQAAARGSEDLVSCCLEDRETRQVSQFPSQQAPMASSTPGSSPASLAPHASRESHEPPPWCWLQLRLPVCLSDLTTQIRSYSPKVPIKVAVWGPRGATSEALPKSSLLN
ncbi:hypothetical protein V2G26_020127 [Clonostachys chloroleuca]